MALNGTIIDPGEHSFESLRRDTAAAVEGDDAAVELTIDDVRARLTPVIQKHSPSVVQTSLSTLGVDKLSALKPEQYQELLDVVAKETGEEV